MDNRGSYLFSLLLKVSFLNGKEFRLTGLKLRGDLESKNFKELDRLHQDKILYYNARVITFRSESDDRLKLAVFERLNTDLFH